jgi:putative transposase
MPRQARIDFPGLVLHVMARGIERRAIFADDQDRWDLAGRLARWLGETGGKCLAWCFMPNHFHLLLRRGERPLSELMRHVMTGYAVTFNHRHGRAGHLFQNRYKSLVCQVDSYFNEVVPYIHLNPLRAGLVGDLEALEGYRWCGHACALRGTSDPLLAREELLGYFAAGGGEPVAGYVALMRAKAETPEKGGVPGGLWRGRAGRPAGATLGKEGGRPVTDRRIFGEEPFVGKVLRLAGERPQAPGRSSAEVLAEVARATGVPGAEVLGRSRCRGLARARAVYCYLCSNEAGCSGSELMRELGLSSGGVSRLVARGRELISSGLYRGEAGQAIKM